MKRTYLLPIFLIVAVDILGLTIILPFLPFYAQKFGATPSTVGLLISTYAFFQLVSGPLLGALSDRFGRRPVLIVSQIGTLIGFFILAHARVLWVVFLSRILDGSTAGNISVAQAYIADVTEPKDRTRAFGIIGIAFGLGFLIGPAISGFLSHFGYIYPVYAAVGLSFLSILGTVFLLPEPPAHAGVEEVRKLSILQWASYVEKFKNPKIGTYLYQFLFFQLAFSFFFSGFPLFAERRFLHHGLPYGVREVGYVYAYTGFLGLIIQGGLLHRLVKKFGEQTIVMVGFLSSAVGYALLGFSGTIRTLLLAATICSFGNAMIRPAITAILSKQVDRREQGALMGLIQSISSVSQIMAPVAAGVLIDYRWLTVWGLTAASFSLVGFFLIQGARRRLVPVSA